MAHEAKLTVPAGVAKTATDAALLRQNMVDERHQLQVIFKDLTYTVQIPNKEGKRKFPVLGPVVRVPKKLLNGVSGIFQPGRLTAVMGASGAGKTSLLQVLAGEARQGSLSGSILVNGENVKGNMKKVSGFVFQDDVILATMTVKEAITMSALLRLPHEMSREAKMEAVENTIKLLNLEKCANTIIGNSTIKGVSGGERKRCAMAMEIITNPSVLYLDEPTSGLDTFTAYSVVSTLKNLALTGRTVIATIHQPSSEIYHLFDDLLLMAAGEIIYAGPAKSALDYFAKYGYHCPDFTNPADYLFMSVLNNEEGAAAAKHATPEGATPNSNNADRIRDLLDKWKSSPESQAYERQLASPRGGGIDATTFKAYAPFVAQFTYLFGRVGKNAIRNPMVIKAKAGQSVVIAIIIGLLFQGTGTDFTASGAQNRNGMLFFCTINNVMSATISNLSIFGSEVNVFAREYGAGYYGLPSYFFSKIIVELPFQIIFPWLFSIVVYWFVGLQNTAGKYFLFLVFIVFSSCCGFSLGIALASVFDSLEQALGAAPMILMPLMLFSGLFVNNGSIPVYFDWIKYISPFKYAYEGLMKNEYGGLSIACQTGSTVLVDGQICLNNLGFNDSFSIAVCVAVLAGMMGCLIVLAYICLYRLVVSKGKAVEPTAPGDFKQAS
ncbi:ABC-2 type transporter-domain-containing protein [Chytriomyces sp. MP71]|nr:ABC-2 type transporter-domain-containing protein [Chytriomyces sp. MP71]